MLMIRLCSLAVAATLFLASVVQGFGFQVSTTMPKVQNHVLQSSVMEGRTSQSQETRDLPPLLQNMADERREFEINLGRAMDTLRKDYPDMLHQTPDFSIFHDEIYVVDPSGVQLTGLKNYKNSFSFLQTLVRFCYNTSESGVQSRMVYDFARQSIRISWNAVLVPKVVGNRRNALYVDGISMYKLDSESGKIIEHKVEQMLINNTPITPPYGIFSTLKEELLSPNGGYGQRIPAGAGIGAGAF